MLLYPSIVSSFLFVAALTCQEEDSPLRAGRWMVSRSANGVNQHYKYSPRVSLINSKQDGRAVQALVSRIWFFLMQGNTNPERVMGSSPILVMIFM